jgi:hypothetical protein
MADVVDFNLTSRHGLAVRFGVGAGVRLSQHHETPTFQ